jgi:hypothetical protein
MPGTPASSHGFGLDRQSRDNNAFRVITVADFTGTHTLANDQFVMGPTDRGIRVDLTGCVNGQAYYVMLPHPAEVGGQVFSVWIDNMGTGGNIALSLTVEDPVDCRIDMPDIVLLAVDDNCQVYSDGLWYSSIHAHIGQT